MGGTSSSTQNSSQTSQLTPYGPAASGLNGILSALNPSIGNINGTPATNQAFSQLIQNAQGPNPYAAPAQAAGTTLLNGGPNIGGATDILKGGYNSLISGLSPYTSGNALDPSSNPALASQLATVNNQVRDTVNPTFSAAGRLASPDNAKAIASGIAQGDTGILQNAASNQLNALGLGMNAAGSTASGLTNADVANSGILSQGLAAAPTAYGIQNLAPQALLAAGQGQQQAPVSMAAALSGILGPLGAQFGQQTGTATGTGTQTMSPLQQFLMGTQAFSNIFGGQGNGAAGNASKLIFG